MISNPFQYLNPVLPKSFVARWPLVKRIALDLTLEGGNSHAIIAGRRCGKSSVLVAMSHQLRQSTVPEQGDWHVHPIAFDFKSGAFATAGGVFARLLHESVRHTDVNTRRRPPDAWPHPVKLDAPWFSELARSDDVNLQQFEEGIGYVLDQLSGSGHHVRLVFLIDEIDDALDKPWTESLFNQLRALVYSGDLRSQVRLVFAGSHRFIEQVSKRGSPLWNILKLDYLDPFDEHGFDELVKSAPDLGKEVVSGIWQQSSGHPFIAQYILHHLWDGSDGFSKADSAKVDTLAGKFVSEQIQDIEGWAQGIDLPGFHAYGVLVAAADWIEERDILRSINNPELNIKRGLLALCYHGLVIHDDGWSHYKCAGDLFKTWFVRYGPQFLLSRKVAEPIISQIVQVTAQTAVFGQNAQIQQDQVKIGNVKNVTGFAVGKNSLANVTQSGASIDEIAKAFLSITAKINEMSDGPKKTLAETALHGLEKEAQKGSEADEARINEWMDSLAQTASDAFDVAVTTFSNPIAGLGLAFKKIAERAKEKKSK